MSALGLAVVHWVDTALAAACGADDTRDGYSSDPAEVTCRYCRALAWWQLAAARPPG